MIASFGVLGWFLIAALVVLIYALGVPLLIIATFKHEAVPTVQVMHDHELPMDAKKHFESTNRQLTQIGFRAHETMLLPSMADNVSSVMRFYTNPRTQDCAIVVKIYGHDGSGWNMKNEFVEFNARFQNGIEVNTGNTSEISAFKTPDKTTTTHIPSIRNLDKLFRVHLAISAAQGGGSVKELQVNTKYGGDTAKFIAAGMRHEFQSAMKDGYVRLSPDKRHYRATIKGGYLMTWSNLPPFKYLVVAMMRSRARKRLQSVGIT